MQNHKILSAVFERVLDALLAVAVTAAVGAAVWRFSPEKPLFSPKQLENGITQETTGVPSRRTVATLDGNEAPAELYTFLLMQYCDEIEYSYGIDLTEAWDYSQEGGENLGAYIRQDVLDRLRQQLLLENLCARYGVTLTEEDEGEIAAMRADAVERLGGEEAFENELYKNGLSEETYLRQQRTAYLFERLYELYNTPGSELYADDDVLRAYAEGAGWITADHILLATIDLYTRQSLSTEEIERKRQLAEELLDRLRDSNDPETLFNELADEYSEDTGRATNPNGYTFTHGTMVTAFDDAAHALAEGEYSDVVESEFGFHIILRRHLDVERAVSQVRDEYFGLFFRGELEHAELTLTPAFDELDDAQLYRAMREAQRAGQTDEEAQTGNEGTENADG